MTKQEFEERLLRDVREKYPDRNVAIKTISKANEPAHDTLQVDCEKMVNGQHIAASQSVDALYKTYQHKGDYDAFLDAMLTSLDESMASSKTQEFNSFVEMFDDYEKLKDNLAYRIIPTAPNEDFLNTVPHKEILNMSVIVMAVGPDYDGGCSSVVIHKSMLSHFGITEEQLFADAEKSAQKIRPYQVKSMAETLAEMMHVPEDELPLPNDGPQMYVVTNNIKIHGASVLAYPKFFDEMAELMNGSFYVIPSSIHELLVIPEKDATELSDLDAMVMEVNTTQVDPTEQLADNAFHYDATEKIFETCEDYKERMEKENDRSDR